MGGNKAFIRAQKGEKKWTDRKVYFAGCSGIPGAGPARQVPQSKHYYGHVPTGRPK